jgi:hypothetical protein
MPENSMFIVLEWIITDKKYWYEADIKGNKYNCYGMVLGCTEAYKETRTYINYLGKGWKKLEDISFENKPRNALIKAKFRIVEN